MLRHRSTNSLRHGISHTRYPRCGPMTLRLQCTTTEILRKKFPIFLQNTKEWAKKLNSKEKKQDNLVTNRRHQDERFDLETPHRETIWNAIPLFIVSATGKTARRPPQRSIWHVICQSMPACVAVAETKPDRRLDSRRCTKRDIRA